MKSDMSTVEASIEKLEDILKAMSGDDVSLEDSISYYAKAAKLIEETGKSLAKAQVKITEIDDKMEQLRLQDDI